MPKNKKHSPTTPWQMHDLVYRGELDSLSKEEIENLTKPRRNWYRDDVEFKSRAEPRYNPDLNINKKEKEELLKRLKGKKKAKASKKTKATTK